MTRSEFHAVMDSKIDALRLFEHREQEAKRLGLTVTGWVLTWTEVMAFGVDLFAGISYVGGREPAKPVRRVIHARDLACDPPDAQAYGYAGPPRD